MDVLEAGAEYYNQDEAAKEQVRLGQESADKLYTLGEDVMEKTQFQPFTVTTGLGGATTNAQGGFDLTLSPEQQALQSQLMTGAGGLFGQVGVDPSVAQANLYEQIRATQRPEEQRQALALEERMLSQGRMGLSSDAYGGATPEMLAQQTAIQEAMGRANLGARTQAMAEQKQALDMATGMMTQGYVPQEQALTALGYGIDASKLAQSGRQEGAALFSGLGQSGVEALMQGAELASDLELGKRQSLTEAIFGSQPNYSVQDRIMAQAYGIDLTAGAGGIAGDLGFGDAPTPQWLKDWGDKYLPTWLGGDGDDQSSQDAATGINQPDYGNYAQR